MIGATHQRLREETRAEHERLEARSDILNRLASSRGRREVVSGFHQLHCDVEAAAAPWVADLPQLEFEARRRSRLLGADLAALGVRPLAARAGALSPPVRAGSLGEALGLLYVLEGSTLGGQVIRRAARASGGDMLGLSFLDPYGPRVGERWRGFLRVLDAAVTTREAADAAVSGARAGFRHAELRLCGAMIEASSDG